MELNPQSVPPTLVAFLLNGCTVDTPVFVRTVLSLAQDGWLEIVPQDQGGGVTLIGIGREPDWDRLSSVEALALERVRAALHGRPAAPLSALTSDDGQDFASWSERYQEAIRTEAQRAGLVNRRNGRLRAAAINLLVALAVGGAAALACHDFHWDGNPVEFGAIVCVVTGAAGQRIAKPFIRLSPTARGRAVAAWWREHGGGLGGTVLGDRTAIGGPAAPSTAELLLAEGSAPLPKGQVWSSFGGGWRPVTVGPVNDRARRRRNPGPISFTGQVVKRWTVADHKVDDEQQTYSYFSCVDDGRSAEAWSFEVDPSSYHKARVGSLVVVDYHPRWFSITKWARLTIVPEQAGMQSGY